MKLHRILRATRDVLTRRTEAGRKKDEKGLSLWTVLGGLLLSALVTAFFVIPNLLGARNSTLNAAAEHNLAAALTAGKTYFAQGDTYNGITPAALQADEPTLTFASSTTVSTGPKAISIGSGGTSGNGWSLVMAAKSTGTGGCYFVADVENTGSSMISSANGIPTPGDYYNNSTSGTCDAASAPTAGWVASGFNGAGVTTTTVAA